MNNERCLLCPLLFCDPLSGLCCQTPEAKLEVMRAIKHREEAREKWERRLANLKLGPTAFAAKMRKRKRARNLETVNAKRKFIAGLGFKKYDPKFNPYLKETKNKEC